jgi:hypothetical protein
MCFSFEWLQSFCTLKVTLTIVINCFDFILLLIEVFNRHSSSGKVRKETPNEPLNLNLFIHNRASHHHHIYFILINISTAIAIFAFEPYKISGKLRIY